MSDKTRTIPSGWKETTLGEVTDVKGGKRIPFGFALQKQKNAHPYIRVTNLVNGSIASVDEYVPDDAYPAIARYTVNKDDVVLSIVGTIGLVAKVPAFLHEANLTENCVKILPNKDVLDEDYLYYYLISLAGQSEIHKNTVGAVQQKLPIYGVQGMGIWLPPLQEQKAIAAVLSSLDDKIELLREQNKTLEATAQALFKEWFVNFNFPDSKGRPYKLSGGKMINSELGPIPEGWRVGKFTDMVTVVGGGTPRTDNPDYWNGEIPFFTPKDAGDIYCMVTEKNITQAGLHSCNSKLFPKNTVFITARGTVGKCALSSQNMAMNQSCYALVGKDISNLFVFLLASYMVGSIQKVASGGVFDAITTVTFEAMNVAVPSPEVLKRFSFTVSGDFEKVLHNSFQNQTLATTRDALLPTLLRVGISRNLHSK